MLLTYVLQDNIIASGQMVMDGIKTKSTGSRPFFSIKKLMPGERSKPIFFFHLGVCSQATVWEFSVFLKGF